MINYADPSLAAGTAVLGLGLVVLPLLSKLNQLKSEEMFQPLGGIWVTLGETHGFVDHGFCA